LLCGDSFGYKRLDKKTVPIESKEKKKDKKKKRGEN